MLFNLMRNEKGLTTLEALLLSVVTLWFGLALATALEIAYIVPSIERAAREAQRELSITHDVVAAKQIAVDKVNGLLATNWPNPPVDGNTKMVFNPNCANSNKDGLPDVILVDNGTNDCKVTIRYHIVCMAPGFPRLLNPDADILDSYIHLEATSSGNREYEPR